MSSCATTVEVGLSLEVQPSKTYSTLYAVLLGIMGIFGVVLNAIVLVGVIGNARLGTTINKLLTWICGVAIMEASLGIIIKSLILGQVIQSVFSEEHNLVICKVLVGFPFAFCNMILVFWTLISTYRLYLVARSVHHKNQQIRSRSCLNQTFQNKTNNPQSVKSSVNCFSKMTVKPSTLLPITGITIGMTIGICMAIYSEAFVLMRECRGSCDHFEGAEWIAAVTMVIPGCLFHIPSGICYSIIYWIVRKHQKRLRLASTLAVPGEIAIKMTTMVGPAENSNRKRRMTIPTIKLTRHPTVEESDDWDSKGLIRRMSLTVMNAFGISSSDSSMKPEGRTSGFFSRSTREATSDLLDPSSRFNDDSSAVDDEEQATHSKRERMAKDSTKVYRIKIAETKGRVEKRRLRSVRMNLRGERNGISPLRETDETSERETTEKIEIIQEASQNKTRSFPEYSSIISLPQLSRSNVGGAPVENSIDALRQINKKKKGRRRRRNIISAKLSVVFIILSVIIGLLLHFGYTQIPENWSEKTLLRAFINAVFFDIILVVVSPLMLLYSSNELRKSIASKFTKEKPFT